MDELNRRKALISGGALGALGALGMAAPAQARALWTWSPQGSVAGTGTGNDPRWIWDPEADPVVAALFERGEVGRVNELLKTWTTNGQPLPDGLPADLRDFIEHARRLPSWADQGKLDQNFDFNTRRGLYLGVLYAMASGMMSTVIPREARAVYYSYGGSHMKDRISETAKLGYDIGTRDAYRPDGEMIVTCVKTRLTHAGVRQLLPQSSDWNQVAPEDIPISQADIMVTWHSLATTVRKELGEWEVPIEPVDDAAYLHSWQVTGHMLGVRDEYIPASWSEADKQSAQDLDPILAPTPEGKELADILLNLGSELDGTVLSKPLLSAFTRYTLGDRIADWLGIEREPVFSPLVETLWIPFVRAREFGLYFPGSDETYYLFEELIRQIVLLYLSEADYPISIEIPQTNR
ncbi:oxygenase MpaB family protein [Saccharomonospora iraqiensis]|uniref:oxygenase MpaB family protein n=1 Tax=Saccharomonospora iraqiensis TaxID=52698 RepID=UPI00022E2B5A|nr:oxygenase MpaB family protein [Saccharomonospora iraqiensis]